MIGEGTIAKLCGDWKPLMLLMNPHSAFSKDRKKLPMFLYTAGHEKFDAMDFRLAASPVEQIIVSDV